MDDLLRLGIDFPNYPQLQEMGHQFLNDIHQGVTPPGVEPVQWTATYLKHKRPHHRSHLKACLTGPFSLAFYTKTKPTKATSLLNTALVDHEQVMQYANILSETCRAYARLSQVIFIDEPLLTLLVGQRILLGYSKHDIIHVYNTLRNACGNTIVGTHVCGRISPLLANILVKTDLDILSHEYSGTPDNFAVYDRASVTTHEKILALGCVSTTDTRVESIDEIHQFMDKAITKYGLPLIFAPDDGFGGLRVDGSQEQGYQVALHKLHHMTRAVSIIKNEK
jgi:5-methyltetrahydropteroyltriglutamate--homocysteine methyltransferase